MNRRTFIRSTLTVGAASCLSAIAATKSGWRIGCYTRPWDQYDYRTALDEIAEAGFKEAGLMTTKSKSRLVISAATTPEEAAQIAGELKQRGLKVPSVYGGGIPVDQSLEAGIADMKRLIENCATCGAGDLMMGGIGNQDLYGRYYKAISETCDYAASKKLTISVKPHGGLNATGPECRKAKDLVNHENFWIWYDPGNILYYSDGLLDPVRDAATVKGLVNGMCVKDYHHPKQVMLTPGTGQVNFKKVLDVLKEGGFVKGPLVVECLKRAGDLKALRKEAERARQFLELITG